MVDTCAAEFDAATPYFYSTYEQENEAEPISRNKAVVIGSGPIRIGQGIEFDYCSVHSAWALQKAGYKSIMVNSNPETVSTDFDTSDRLYFEALDEESLRDILENEGCGWQWSLPPQSSSSAGRRPSTFPSLCPARYAHNRLQSPIPSTSPATADVSRRSRPTGHPPTAGRRSHHHRRGSQQWPSLSAIPVLVRPSYVLGGRAMEIVHDATELVRYMDLAIELDTKHPVLIDKYLEGKECEVDAVCDGESVFIPGIMEHIERAGVHSGDSMAVYPGVRLTEKEVETIVDYTVRIGLGLQVKGLMNIQFVIMPGPGTESSVYVLEVNPRASRTVPFISKVTGVPMVKVATRVMLGTSLKEQGYQTGLYKKQNLVASRPQSFRCPSCSVSILIWVRK